MKRLSLLREHLCRNTLSTKGLAQGQVKMFSSKPEEVKGAGEVVEIEKYSKNVMEFRLNQPKRLNALDLNMMKVMLAEIKRWSNEQIYPKVLIMRGTGGKAFCAGGDVRSLYDGSIDPSKKHVHLDFFQNEYLLDYALATMKPFQIVIWNGIVMGGGAGLTMNAPVRIATELSLFAMPESGIGFFTDVGAGYFLPRLGGSSKGYPLGLYLGLTGQRLKAKELYDWGVATHYMSIENANKLVEELKEKADENTDESMIKSIVDKYSSKEGKGSIPNENDIRATFTDEGGLLGVQKRLEQIVSGEIPGDKAFAEKTLSTLKKMSPFSLHLIFEQLRRGKDMDLLADFEMEYKLAQGMMNHTEMFEGVRALLVEKDLKPKWKHAKIEDVTKSEVDAIFNRTDKMNFDINLY